MSSRNPATGTVSRGGRQLKPLRTFPTRFLDHVDQGPLRQPGDEKGSIRPRESQSVLISSGPVSSTRSKRGNAPSKKRRTTDDDGGKEASSGRRRAARLLVRTSDGVAPPWSDDNILSEAAERTDMRDVRASSNRGTGSSRSDDIVTSSAPSGDRHDNETPGSAHTLAALRQRDKDGSSVAVQHTQQHIAFMRPQDESALLKEKAASRGTRLDSPSIAVDHNQETAGSQRLPQELSRVNSAPGLLDRGNHKAAVAVSTADSRPPVTGGQQASGHENERRTSLSEGPEHRDPRGQGGLASPALAPDTCRDGDHDAVVIIHDYEDLSRTSPATETSQEASERPDNEAHINTLVDAAFAAEGERKLPVHINEGNTMNHNTWRRVQPLLYCTLPVLPPPVEPIPRSYKPRQDPPTREAVQRFVARLRVRDSMI